MKTTETRTYATADYADMLTPAGAVKFAASIRHNYFGRAPKLEAALKEFVIAAAGTQRREGHQKWLNQWGLDYTNSLS